MRAGGLYEVNENGTEMFVPPVNGMVLKASQTARALAGLSRRPPSGSGSGAGGGRASTTVHNKFDVKVIAGPGASVDELLDKLERQLGGMVASANRAAFSDG